MACRSTWAELRAARRTRRRPVGPGRVARPHLAISRACAGPGRLGALLAVRPDHAPGSDRAREAGEIARRGPRPIYTPSENAIGKCHAPNPWSLEAGSLLVFLQLFEHLRDQIGGKPPAHEVLKEAPPVGGGETRGQMAALQEPLEGLRLL